MPGRAAYFESLNSGLKEAGVFQPALILDLDRLDGNIATLRSHLPVGMGFRVVAKSLPVPKLITYICEAMGTNKLMTFNYPMLTAIAKDHPEAEQLLGKPLPASALRAYLQQDTNPDVALIHWLIDTPERLEAYIDVAQAFGCTLNIVLELDVGLHRGGFDPGAQLDKALKLIRGTSCVTFSGFMGYEPHLASVPKAFGWQGRAIKRAWGVYQDALKIARSLFSEAVMAGLIRNAAGSPTYRLYGDITIANEISAGSALVKPTDFDTKLLEPFTPACFIAAPVLKATGRTQIPALEFADGFKRMKSPKSEQTFFIHGGKWMATPVDPPNLSYNQTFGRSSNQEMINGPSDTALSPGDFIFFRPHQSEAVMLQFGDVVVVRRGEILDHWPAFDVSA